LQIGHQRRSNPKYRFAKENIIDKKLHMKKGNLNSTGSKDKDIELDSSLLGQITTINGQWNRGAKACRDLGWPKGTDIAPATLKKYGFKNMSQFRNWRWYKGLGGGPIVDLGSHQIDIYSWFLGEAMPKSVMASGGVDYWKGHEWYDNVMAIFEFDSKAGPVRAFYQTLTTTGSGGYFERFMGVNGTLEISEDPRFFKAGRQPKLLHDKSWEPWIDSGLITKDPKPPKKKTGAVADSRSSPPLIPYTVSSDSFKDQMKLPYHAPHLANFFDAIRDSKVKLNCPAEIGYHTAVMVHKVNEAVEARKTLDFKKEDFHV
jgi:predicted dehydrogenase